MKVALVYDRVNKFGGAERVLQALHELFPHAPLYTSVYNPTTTSWANTIKVEHSWVQHLPFAKRAHELYALCMPIAFESFSFVDYDLVISVTSEAAKGIITGPKTTHICYCLTPTRYLWSGYRDYFTSSLFRFIAAPAVWYLRQWDLIAAARPDHMVAISQEVKKRIKTYYHRDAVVIYPPGEIPKPTLHIPNNTQNTKSDPLLSSSRFNKSKTRRVSEARIQNTDYFLVVSRLVPYKRIDIAIDACNALGLPLKIVGVGSEMTRLQKRAGPTITFLGSLTDDELVQYYRGCTALLFPGSEDFGLTIVEAQQQGKPVIAYYSGGAKETIQKGKTGEFFYSQDWKALAGVLKTFRAKKYTATRCQEQAEKFSKKRFKELFMQYIEKLTA